MRRVYNQSMMKLLYEGEKMKDEKNQTEKENALSAAGIPFVVSDELYGRTRKIMWSMVRYKELQMQYVCAIKEVRTKFEVLNTEFNVREKRNPISSISARLKSTESVLKKMQARGLPPTLDDLEKNIFDMAGVRVVCAYIDDIYKIAEAFLSQDDIRLIRRKDYIKNPKPNGYRSLHLIVSVPVFFSEQTKNIPVEVQIRTIAMDFWASLEHQIKYKKEIPEQERIVEQLRECAEIITRTDEEMLSLRRRIESAEDIPSEEEELLDKFKKIDVRM